MTDKEMIETIDGFIDLAKTLEKLTKDLKRINKKLEEIENIVNQINEKGMI